MTNFDAVLRWGALGLALAALTSALSVFVGYVLSESLRVSIRNRRARRAMLPVSALGDVPPTGAVVIEGLLALPPRSALSDRDDLPAEEARPVIETPGRRVRLDGAIRVLAGTVDVVAPDSVGRSVMRGAAVRARGRVRIEASAESDAYRSESATWSLVPEGAAIEVVALKTRRVRGQRRGRALALAATAAVIPVGVAIWQGARAFAAIGAPTVALSSVRGDTARWRRVWSVDDRNRLAIAALSPLLRHKVQSQRARESEFETVFPPTDRDEAAHLARVLRANGDCVHEALLALRTGDAARAIELAERCADSDAIAVARDARCLRDPSSDACLLGYLIEPSLVTRWEAVFDARASRRAAVGGGSPRAEDPGPITAASDAVSCAMTTALREPPGATQPSAAGAWDDLLSAHEPGCRVLGATRASRREAAALGALLDAGDQRRPDKLLAHARAYVQLTGMDSGRITAPICSERRPPAELDPEFLAAHPTLALAFVRAASSSGCAWVADRVYLVAAQAFARFLAQAGTPPASSRCGGGRCEGLVELQGWMWHVDAVRAHRTLSRAWGTALHRLDARYSPRHHREHDASAAALLMGLPAYVIPALDSALERDGHWPGDFTWASVARAMAAVDSPSTWSMRPFAEVRGLHQHQMDHAPVWSAPEAGSQDRAPLLASLVDYWRTGVWSPSREAPAVYRSPRMRRAVDAALTWNTESVLRAIGAPDDDGVVILAAVAPRLSGRRPVAESWLRAALGYRPPSSRTSAEQVIHLARVVSAARRLRLSRVAGEAESLRAASLDALFARDPWVSAVLDGARASR